MSFPMNKERYERFICVDTKAQKLYLVESGNVVRSFDVSTSKYGVGNRENSFQTPPGVHVIIEKIGEGAPSGRIFKDRLDTGIDWRPGLLGENMILTRILRLQGLEPGINSGPGIDTYERYVYIHGTNREDLIGTPMSHGCVCMRNRDIMDLFDSVEEGTIVVID
jgi:lipoprotein-anchoring transpeptidase ErfK/SrfK